MQSDYTFAILIGIAYLLIMATWYFMMKIGLNLWYQNLSINTLKSANLTQNQHGDTEDNILDQEE